VVKPAAPVAPKPAPKAASEEIVITRDMIATRAYYIGERRQMMGWGGDSSTDWIEAESQLIAEAKRKKKS
jgi:alpha-glucosidase (family GH31 glycosyl hydrolase)